MESKTLTILFIDIQGFTLKTSKQTREENAEFIKSMRNNIEKHVAENKGKLIKAMGDGFLITFESPTNAVRCGAELQKEAKSKNSNILNKQNIIKYRVGISTGEVNIDQDGDVYGDAVNIAARIENFAEADGVFISESTYLAMNQAEISAKDLGPQQFKNVVREIRVYKVICDEGDRTRMMRVDQFETPKKKEEKKEKETKKNKKKTAKTYQMTIAGLIFAMFIAYYFKLKTTEVDSTNISKTSFKDINIQLDKDLSEITNSISTIEKSLENNF